MVDYGDAYLWGWNQSGASVCARCGGDFWADFERQQICELCLRESKPRPPVPTAGREGEGRIGEVAAPPD